MATSETLAVVAYQKGFWLLNVPACRKGDYFREVLSGEVPLYVEFGLKSWNRAEANVESHLNELRNKIGMHWAQKQSWNSHMWISGSDACYKLCCNYALDLRKDWHANIDAKGSLLGIWNSTDFDRQFNGCSSHFFPCQTLFSTHKRDCLEIAVDVGPAVAKTFLVTLQTRFLQVHCFAL